MSTALVAFDPFVDDLLAMPIESRRLFLDLCVRTERRWSDTSKTVWFYFPDGDCVGWIPEGWKPDLYSIIGENRFPVEI